LPHTRSGTASPRAWFVRNGVALDTVADCLGHASSATTFIYTKLAFEDLRSVSLDPREVIP
jgi:site-specific recombinase XerD